MSNPDDRAHLPAKEHSDNGDEPRERRSRHGGAKHDKRKRKLALGSRGQHRHRRHQHHHRRQREDQPEQGAGMSAEELLEHFRILLQEGEDRPGMDIQKARNAMEATAGNIEMAAQLYWDDYVASQAVANAAPPEQEDSEADRKVPARRNRHHDSDDEEDDYDPPSPGLRRSLDGDFGRAADDVQVQRANHGGDEEDEADQDVRRGQHHAQIQHAFAGDRQAPMELGENSDGGEEEGHGAVDPRQLQRQMIREAILGQQARLDMGESVSVSDDETGCAGVWRIVGTMVAQLDEDDGAAGTVSTRRDRRLPANEVGQRVREAAAAVADKVLSQPDPSDHKKTRRHPQERNEEEDDLEYISDAEWLEEDSSPMKDPFELLWGTSNKSVSSDASLNDTAEGNVVADEDSDEKSRPGVPHTWLHASFSLSECGTGLMLQPPKVEDIEFFTWRQQQNHGRNNRNGVPPPHHCKAVTAIISIVTAMLYTGASIQGDEVNCTSAKAPFAGLSADRRQREFEGRLADALAALMFIAGQASMKRKKRAMNKQKESEGEEVKSNIMKRRLHLIPTCTWEDDPSAGMPRQPDSPSHRYIQLATSLTNLDDIRLFVLSSIRAFMSRGGVALLLETILRIHGQGVVGRMIERARKKTGFAGASEAGLIGCTCEERQKQIFGDKPLPANVRNNPSRLLDTTPPGHECVSVELISLLLTGTVHSSWSGWSAKGLDFGILTKKSGEVGFELTRPERPVWILQGDTCYSVLLLRDGKELDPRSVAKLDKKGAVLDLAHWNCWYELRNKSEFRLILASNDWMRPELKQIISADKWASCRNPLEPRSAADILLERRRYNRVNLISENEHDSNLKKSTQSHITESDVENATQNSEDESFYPNNYKMWRFDMGGDKGAKQCDERCEAGDAKMRAERWVPYHRLTTKHKLIVDMKMGPPIMPIIWSRWPGSRIDKFIPEDGEFPIV